MRLHQDPPPLQAPALDPDPGPDPDPSPDLRTARGHSVDLVLDPDSAHPWLVLSEDLKQVRNDQVWKPRPPNPRSFTYCPAVVGIPQCSSGCFYFEVQVPQELGPSWDVGVTRECSRRRGRFFGCPENGYWRIMRRNRDQYTACSNPPRPLQLQGLLGAVGVYVDLDLGLVSFYEADSGALIHSFRGCRFGGPVVPYLSPFLNLSGTNSSPLVLVQEGPVPHLDWIAD